jgi:anti-sigma factor ChrR (cupin superfamily)
MSHDIATEETREMAALYSAGVLEPERAAEFEEHLRSGCVACASELRAFKETGAQLVFALPERKPPARLRDRLMNRIGANAEPDRVLVRAHEGEWKSSGFPGVALRRLFVDQNTGNVTWLLKVEPGGVYPAHRHFGLEHCYVLEGDVVFEDHVLQAGDYEVAMSSSAHSTVTTTQGCLLLLINNQRDQVLASPGASRPRF